MRLRMVLVGVALLVNALDAQEPRTLLAYTSPTKEANWSQGVVIRGSTEKISSFEVATIREVNPDTPERVGPIVDPGGRIIIRGFSLKSLIAVAFRLSGWQVTGGGDWTRTVRYDLEAKPPETVSSTKPLDLRYTNWAIEDERLRLMLQALLVDRFHLKVRWERKIGKVYLLTSNGKPLRLRPTKIPKGKEDTSEREGFSGDLGFAGGRWVIFNTSLPQLAKFASDNILRAPVLDQTGLIGSYDYEQKTILSDEETYYKDPSDSFLQLVSEVGLKLNASRGLTDILVIVGAERPTPN